MTIKVYASDFSPPCRAVWLLLETLEIPYEHIETSIFKGDNRTPEFLRVSKSIILLSEKIGIANLKIVFTAQSSAYHSSFG